MIGPRKFRLVSADACGGGTRDESLRESAWEANYKAQSKRFKEEGRLLPFFPAESFYTGK